MIKSLSQLQYGIGKFRSSERWEWAFFKRFICTIKLDLYDTKTSIPFKLRIRIWFDNGDTESVYMHITVREQHNGSCVLAFINDIGLCKLLFISVCVKCCSYHSFLLLIYPALSAPFLCFINFNLFHKRWAFDFSQCFYEHGSRWQSIMITKCALNRLQNLYGEWNEAKSSTFFKFYTIRLGDFEIFSSQWENNTIFELEVYLVWRYKNTIYLHSPFKHATGFINEK